jgi:hypothetical protein
MPQGQSTAERWRVWYARLCRLIDRDHERADDAGLPPISLLQLAGSVLYKHMG